MKRTTLELDEELVARAMRALGCRTMRAAIEEALRQAVRRAEDESALWADRQSRYLKKLRSHVDQAVLASDAMWR